MRTYNDDDIAQIKAKWRLPAVLDVELPEHGIALPLAPFTPASFARFVDEDLANHDAAAEALLSRHLLFYSPSEQSELRRRCASLPQKALDILCADAGFPIQPPARVQVDAFDDATPPGVLALAGLDEAKAEQLRADVGDSKAKLVTVIGDEGAVIFSGVVRAPGEAETGILRKAEAAKKGYADACRSAADGCLVWSSATLADTWARYPAIVVLVLAVEISSMGGSAATKRFRRR